MLRRRLLIWITVNKCVNVHGRGGSVGYKKDDPLSSPSAL